MHFQREMNRLNQHLVSIGKQVEEQVTMAFNAFVQMDVTTARKVIKGDAEVDNVEVEMEEECLKLLALYQPVANDLRLIVAVLKINNDLERIGDHAKNMAEIVLQMAENGPIKVPENMIAIFEKTKLMLRKVLLAFVELDIKIAEAVLAMDDEVDALCKSQLPLQIEMIQHEPDYAGQHLMLLSVCRQLERIGDHASNIAEDIIYLLTGDIIRHSISGSMSRASTC
ncbi:MAG: phosphate signaling complex protein PhoU [Gammaproteobacteria bacterium]